MTILKIIDDFEAMKYSSEHEKTQNALFKHAREKELAKKLRAFDLRPNKDSEYVTIKNVLNEFDKYLLDNQNETFDSFKLL